MPLLFGNTASSPSFTPPNIVTSSLQYYIDAANPASYSGSGTTVYDLSGNSNTSALVNGVSFSIEAGGTFVFDGTNDYINVPYAASLNTPSGATFEIWAYRGASAGTILARGTSDSASTPDNPRIVPTSSGSVYYDWSTTGSDKYASTATSVFPAGVWRQLVLTATPNSNMAMYVNNVDVSTSQLGGALPSPLYNSNTPLIIGGSDGGWAGYYQGNIAVVRVYSKVLNSTELLQNYNAQKTRFGL